MKTISDKTVFTGKFLNINETTVEYDNGHRFTVERVKKYDAVAVIPFTEEGIYLVRQPRPAVGAAELLEIPAGLIDVAGEDKLSCAQRELQEETGFTADNWEELFAFQPSPGCLDEEITVYSASELNEGKQDLGEDEFISVEFYLWQQALEMIASQQIVDGKTIAAIYRLYLSHKI